MSTSDVIASYGFECRNPAFVPGSFRDRSARVVLHDGVVYRVLDRTAWSEWRQISGSSFFQHSVQSGRVIDTELAPEMDAFAQQQGFTAALRHQRLPFISWPYEWCFSMLREAALLTLELMEESVSDGLILTDASPYNIQFLGAVPILMDTGSISVMRAGQAWEGYRQFCQMMLYPLMLQAYRGISFQPWLRGSLEGITPEQFVSVLRWRDLLRTGVFSHGWLHAKLSQSAGVSDYGGKTPEVKVSPEGVLRNVAGLKQTVMRLNWTPKGSVWSDYDASSRPVQRDASEKESFVDSVCRDVNPQIVWDLGCHQGRYSRIAAKHAALVLAMDSDHVSVDRLYQALRLEQERRIIPLVFDFADPSPSLGWRGMERTTLEQRSDPDLVLCLALIHHLVIGRNILMSQVIDWLASLNARIVIEFVDRDDEQVRGLLRHRRDVFSDYSGEGFVRAVGERFIIEREQPLQTGTRTLFVLAPRG